jgi:hypothetical protein
VIDDPAAAVESTTDPQGAPPADAPTPSAVELASPVGHRTSTWQRWWTAALALVVLVTAGGFALVYNDDQTSQKANQALTTQNESLQGQNLGLQGQLSAMQTNLAKAQTDLATAQSALMHPVLEIWNVSQTVQGPSYYLAAGIPDTFTYHLQLTSTGPMNVSIVSFDQFSAAIRCFDNGRGDANWCMHHSGAVIGWPLVRSVNYDFHLAEGCAAYMVVITAPNKITVQPTVSVTYNPAPHATGTCA